MANSKWQIVIFLALLVLALPVFFILAQSQTEERETLEEELRRLEEQISQYETNIYETQQKKQTLQNKIYILQNKIKKLNLQIYQSNVIIGDLKEQIRDTEGSIENTSRKINQSSQGLVETLRAIYEEDQKSLLEILISQGVSEFFDNLANLESLSQKSKELLINIKALKQYLEEQKAALEEERERTERMVIVIGLQKQESEEAKAEQEKLLALTEGQEQVYQEMLAEAKKRAQEIRSRIFELIGVPQAPTFGEALEIAKWVSGETGIRPALLLAVLTQESNIGKNVGQCYLKNPSDGSGVRAGTGKALSRVMNPKRDIPHFLGITKELGRDPYNTPVSCPLSFGWGGAMGPAQFIPSTWVAYKDEIASLINKTPDPWNIKDAFLAAGVYLKKLGVLENEFKGVMRYFSGYRWSKYEEFYGRSVLAIAARYEEDIRTIEASQ